MAIERFQHPSSQGHHQKGEVYAVEITSEQVRASSTHAPLATSPAQEQAQGYLSAQAEGQVEGQTAEQTTEQAVEQTAHLSSPPPPSPATPHPRSWRIPMMLRVIVGVLAVMLIGGGGTLYAIGRSWQGEIPPNTTIQGVPVGSMTMEEAEETLRSAFAPFLDSPVTFTFHDETWQPTPEELGVMLKIEEAVHHTYQLGHAAGFVADMRRVAAVWSEGMEVPLSVSIDQATLQDYLQTIAEEVEHPAIEADLFIQNTLVDRDIARDGRQLLLNETMQDTVAAVQRLEPQTVPLRTRMIPPLIDNEDAIEAEQRAKAILQAPLTIEVNKESWSWSVEELETMIQVERVEDLNGHSNALSVTLDKEIIKQRIKEIADESSIGSINPRVNWNGGNLSIFRQGEPGLRINEEETANIVCESASSDNRTIELPFTEVEPTVTEDNLDELGIEDLLGVGRSDFSGSEAYRITNIKAGMNLLHGILIPPGEEFSFNRSIGSISPQNGFVEGYAIVSNRTQLEWGGGICQDSTTMFRAAFWAGLPITERWGHSFYISWYNRYGFGPYGDGAGMDATIYTGPNGRDFRFVNDTGHWILIQTAVNTAQALAEVRIYGKDTGRTVELIGPETYDRKPAPSEPVYVANSERSRYSPRRSDVARGGMTIAFTRIILEEGVEVDRQRFVTRFKPWPNIYEVHPADVAYYQARARGQTTQSAPTTQNPTTTDESADGTTTPTDPNTDPNEEGTQPTEPQPTTPDQPVAPEQPAPQPPAPVEPTAVPAPEQPAPQPPAPVEPTAVPAPEQPAPQPPAPVEPTAVPAPEQPAPQPPAPVEPTAVPAPEQPAPQPPAPVEPTAVPAPEQPAPQPPAPAEPTAVPAPEQPAPQPPAPAEPTAVPAPEQPAPQPPVPVEPTAVPAPPAPEPPAPAPEQPAPEPIPPISGGG